MISHHITLTLGGSSQETEQCLNPIRCASIALTQRLSVQSISACLPHHGQTKIQTDQSNASYTEMKPSTSTLIGQLVFPFSEINCKYMLHKLSPHLVAIPTTETKRERRFYCPCPPLKGYSLVSVHWQSDLGWRTRTGRCSWLLGGQRYPSNRTHVFPNHQNRGTMFVCDPHLYVP